MRDVEIRHFVYSQGVHNLLRVTSATVKIDYDGDDDDDDDRGEGGGG